MIKSLYNQEQNQDLLEDYKKSDKFMLNLIFVHWILVSTLSAYIYNTYFLGFIGGGMLFFITFIAYKLYRGTAIFRIMVSIILMTYTIISIQQNLGQIEMHFHVFIVLSFLTVYKDLLPATIAAIYIAIHHILFTYLQLNGVEILGTQIMVFNYGCGYDIALLHAFFVIFEWLVLYKIISGNRKNFNEINLYKNQFRDSNNNLQELFDLAGEAIIIFDENYDTVDDNIAAQKIFGYSKDEFKAKNLFDFVPKDELHKVEIAFQEEQSEPHEINLYRKDGSIFPTISRGINIIRDGKSWRMITVQDLTDIKNREKSLIKSEKMASMGEMIGNIAHQWRQPLSVISTGATGLILHKQCGILTDDSLEETCEMINQNAQYLSKTIDDFKNFIKNDRKRMIFKLEDEIDSFMSLVSGSIKNHNLTVITDIQKDIQIDGFQNELTQCIINIFNNAKDALNVNIKEDKLIFISTLIEDNKAVIKIKDNAGGIPIEILPKIFDPYFTTKHQSQGTGLGLHMSYNLIVDGMNGILKAKNINYSYKGKNYTGAEFTIMLPLFIVDIDKSFNNLINP